MPIRRIDIYLERRANDELSDEENDRDTAPVHALAATFPPEVKEVAVFDRKGVFLYYADGREG